jgi:hypothetical protein
MGCGCSNNDNRSTIVNKVKTSREQNVDEVNIRLSLSTDEKVARKLAMEAAMKLAIELQKEIEDAKAKPVEKKKEKRTRLGFIFGSKKEAIQNEEKDLNQSDDIEEIDEDDDEEDDEKDEVEEIKKAIVNGPTPLPRCVGYLSKEGGSWKTWKSRFFTLDNGVLTYYESETTPGSNEGVNEKGKIPLCGTDTIEFIDRKKGKLLLSSAINGRKYPLIVDNLDLADAWRAAIDDHIKSIRNKDEGKDAPLKEIKRT